ncbi:ORF V: Enzymatic polyprotein [Labeo rohita]|uniref:ORF V: Enzymatic polyprotein n=1 Tax=Labeo rohita TaxID=84645 RepID=A0ABQ8LHZ5_LABRO|nr:ORF V: Enzymatic polyprotein [Labeo rohita]
MESEKRCVPPCVRLISEDDPHGFCFECLGEEHAALRAWLAFFKDEQAAAPLAAVLGVEFDLAEARETGTPLSLAISPDREVLASVSEARPGTSSERAEDTASLASAEIDIESATSERSSRNDKAYEELLEVVTRAVDRLKLDWPQKQETLKRSKLDDRFLSGGRGEGPQRRSLPFFGDLHDELARSWSKPYSSRVFVPSTSIYSTIVDSQAQGYMMMPQVEETLAGYLSPGSSSSLKKTYAPNQALQTNIFAGRRGVFRTSPGHRSVSPCDKADGPCHWLLYGCYGLHGETSVAQPHGLFGDAVDLVVTRFREAKRYEEAFVRFLPRRAQASGLPEAGCPEGECGESCASSQRLGNGSTVGVCPLGEGRVKIQQRIGAPSRHPQETTVLPPPPLVFRGAAVSGEVLHGRLPPAMFQDTVHLTSRQISEVSKLVPLSEKLAAWKLLPDISPWVARTVERGYRIQFVHRPPHFNGAVSTSVKPERVHLLTQELQALDKRDIEHVPLPDRESGFYSRYFLVPKKDGGAASNFGSSRDAYFHIEILPQHRKFLRFAFGGRSLLVSGSSIRPSSVTPHVYKMHGCSTGSSATPGHPHFELHRRLAHSGPVSRACASTSGCRPSSSQISGVEKSILSPTQRTTYLGVVWDSITMQAQLAPACVESILNTLKDIKLGQKVSLHYFQRVLGLMAAASTVIPLGLLHMRLFQLWLRARGFHPRANPQRQIRVTRQGFRPRFLTLGPTLGPCCHRKMLTTDASLTGWGAVLNGRPAQGIWKGHHLNWHMNCLEMMAVFRALKYFLQQLRGYHVLVRVDNTAVVSYINRQGGLRSRRLNRLVPVPQSDIYSGAYEYGSRLSVQTSCDTRGMETPPRSSQSNLGKILRSRGGPLCFTGDSTMSPLLLSDSSSSPGSGRDGPHVAQTASLRISPDCSAPGSPSQGPLKKILLTKI